MERAVSYPGGPQVKVRAIVFAVLATILAWQILIVIAASASRNLMFDGAMNLEISKSIAEGDGPRRMYDSGELFPPGVQSKEPFVLLGAVVFKVFGMGHWQAQLPNLIYFLLAIAVIVIVVRRTTDAPTALTAGIFALATPAFTQYALNGYGEIPTLFFGLSSLAVVALPDRFSTHLVRRSLLAGALAALAFATKVVGVVQIAAIGIVLLFRVFTEARGTVQRLRSVALSGLAFAGGMLIPLFLIECWRWFWLGKDGYVAWWTFQFNSIMSQSGAAPRVPGLGLADKLSHHFGLLAAELHRSRAATAALVVIPLIAIGFSFGRLPPEQRQRCRWLLLGLLVLVVLYFPWWLAMVPTEKAWLRYLYIGLIALAILSAVAITTNVREAIRTGNTGRRIAHAVLAAAVCLVYWPFVSTSVRKDVEFQPSEEVQAVKYAAAVISRLESNQPVFGYGWYAAPTIQLYADRGFSDLTDWPIGRLTGAPAYMVADRATLTTDMLKRVLTRYPSKKLMRSNPYAQVYEVDFANPNDPFAGMDVAAVRSSVNFSEVDYPLTSGLEPYDPMGGRFTESDSEVLLKYEGQDVLALSGYMALPSFYRRPEPLSGRIVVNDCPPMPFAFRQTGWQDFTLPLTCKPDVGSNVRVRILLDNTFDLPLLYDRQRALLLRSIGFAD